METGNTNLMSCFAPPSGSSLFSKVICIGIRFSVLTLSSLQTSTDTFANSADPDETAHKEPSHQDLHCLPLLLNRNPYLHQWMCPNSGMEDTIPETQRLKG